ncbi:hypothetical protein TW95_gp0273 [Pandoravirus inopinatum]|uniref:Uncharacterized protein n=1 Tax=Pandoravirus inopinatum TaxID=1605721 RepID=A0A0B5JBR2_9VIRU|nr:hypothetical protein TW95_gp0273 [Pandoravirus inopinatum]AJF97007.1 hypothetical protein [Pandoravirus inopinatum]
MGVVAAGGMSTTSISHSPTSSIVPLFLFAVVCAWCRAAAFFRLPFFWVSDFFWFFVVSGRLCIARAMTVPLASVPHCLQKIIQSKSFLQSWRSATAKKWGTTRAHTSSRFFCLAACRARVFLSHAKRRCGRQKEGRIRIGHSSFVWPLFFSCTNFFHPLNQRTIFLNKKC